MKTAPTLAKFSWQTIFNAYHVYLKKLKDIDEAMERFGIEKPLQPTSEMPLGRAEIVSKALLDVNSISTHVNALNREIERRRALVGVWG